MSVISGSVYLVNDPAVEFESNGTTWKIYKNNADGMSFWNSSSLVDVMEVKNDGTVDAPGVLLTKKVTLKAQVGDEYDVVFPANAPVGDNKALAYKGGYVWLDVFPRINNTVVVKKNPTDGAVGEYGSIYSAVGGIVDASVTNPYVVLVYPGIYVETATIVLPEYVYVVGMSLESCIVTPQGDFSLFQLGKRSGVSFLLLKGGGATSPIVRIVDGDDYAVMHKVEIEDSPKGIYCESTTVTSLVYLEYVSFSDATDYALWVEDNDSGFVCEVSIENFFTYGAVGYGIYVHGDNAHLINNSSLLQGDGTGIGIYAQKATQVTLRSTYIQNFQTGVKVDSLGTGPELICSGVFFTGCTKNVDINNSTCTGYFIGYSEFLKTTIDDGCSWFISNKDTRIVTVGKRGADFTSVKSAVEAITAGPNARYEVYVGPGTFVEDPFVVPSYVGVSGRNPIITVLQANSMSLDFIRLSGRSYLNNLTIRGPSVGASLVFNGDPNGFHVRLSALMFGSAQVLFKVRDTSGPFLVLGTYLTIDQSASFTNGFDIYDSAGYGGAYIINNTIWGPVGGTSVGVVYKIRSDSVGKHFGYLMDNYLGNSVITPSGIGIQMDGGCNLTVTGCVLGGFTIGIKNDNAFVSAPVFTVNSTQLVNNTLDIGLDNAAIAGSIQANASRAKTRIVGDVSVNLFDQGDMILSGEIYQGDSFANVTNITKMVQKNGILGGIQGGVLTQTGALQVTVSAGYGYLDVSGTGKFVEWSGAVLNIAPNSVVWIYVTNGGVVTQNGSRPDENTVVLLGIAQAAASLWLVGKIRATQAYKSNGFMEAYDRVVGIKIYSGCLATPGSGTRDVDVSAGIYYTSTTKFSPSAKTSISMSILYTGGFNTTTTTVPTSYDNSGTITALGAGEWAKHLLMTQDDGSTQSYVLCLGQQKYNSSAEAIGGVLPVLAVPETCVRIAGLVVSGASSSVIVVDVRPLPEASVVAYNSTSDHNSLQNLTVGDVHTQYLLASGSRSMSGGLNMGGNSISNVGLVAGVNVAAHASRHLPNGADALAVGVPVSVGTANSQGVANSFALSDHVHNHGNQTAPGLHAVVSAVANGFMISTDKVKLDGASVGAVSGSLVLRDVDSSVAAASLKLVSTKTLTLQPSVGMSADGSYIFPTGDGTSGQVLTTNGGGQLSWATTNPGFVDPTTTRGDIIVRGVSATGRLGIGTQRQKLVSLDGDVVWSNEYLPLRETLFVDDFRGVTTPYGEMPVWAGSTSGGGASISNTNIVTGNYTGIVNLTTGNTSSGRVFVTALNHFIAGWGTFVCEFSVYLLNALSGIQNYVVYVGLGDTTTVEPVMGAYFTITNGTNWVCRTSNGGTRTSVTTAVAGSSGSWVKFKITYGVSGFVFFINEVSVATINTNVPVTRIGPVLAIQKTVGNNSATLSCDYFSYAFYYSGNRY